MSNILIIDDDRDVRDVLAALFSGEGFDVTAVPDGMSGLGLLRQCEFDIIFIDLVMPGMSGLDVLKELTAIKTDVPAVIMTAFAAVNTAVNAMKLGAFDYVTKPFNLDALLIMTKRILTMRNVMRENVMLKKQLSGLLPVCAWCRKIRDEKGRWKTIEDYIKERDKVAFSHGICPDCLKRTNAET